MQELKNKIKDVINSAGMDKRAIVALLDDIRKDYHTRKNVGDKVVSQKELSKMVALVNKKEYPLSKDKKTVFYQGGWRAIRGEGAGKHFLYIGSVKPVKFKRNSNS